MNYIWDLDGTLLDSYPMIAGDCKNALNHLGIDITLEEARRGALLSSVPDFLRSFLPRLGISFEELMVSYNALRSTDWQRVELMPGAVEILSALKAAGGRNFVYSHRGQTAVPMLKRLGIAGLFDDILTAETGLPRKPAPDGVDYLIEKHGLLREETFYVGDRLLDMGCAANAHVRGILYLPEGSPVTPDGQETYIVRELIRISDIGE